MKLQNRLLILGIGVFLAVCSTACTSQSRTSNSSTRGGKVSPLEADRSTPTAKTVSVIAGTAAFPGIAPTYQEIRDTVYRITHTAEHPEGPEVGSDGIVDQRIVDQLDAYNSLLAGKEVKGWVGCAGDVFESSRPQGGYGVGIRMSINGPKMGDYYADVLLWGVTQQQVESLNLSEARLPSNCIQVKYSGIFDDVGSDGRVEISNPTIERIP